MKLDHLISSFRLSPFAASNKTLQGVQSAVLVPLVEVEGSAHILLCKRNASLRAHPSQICFPGGKVEQHDSSAEDTALRETFEEISLAREQVTTLGQLPTHSSLSGFHITPVVARVQNSATWQQTSSEVDSVFTVSLSALMDPNQWQSYPCQIRGNTININGFMTSHGLLWGATASIIKKLTKSLS
ncbi:MULTISPECIES: CoA pyrophosphatase [Pseudoalteromonas]|uniref:CoA pyrophosphatase n=1 Tax=Pseudoalteromonas obscura TaxID=3048491 RepID=A0ABT7ESK1_9GAMM|nr:MULTISPECIES: CoA pyrophosphatase [Pseudoalteromonas]MBQ4835311.1 CoA pyrophosphatase [Pseudoalteromonas luteoviolacea]MDK2598046.1 CoA pyrophosphatase [Pseudoalteromonas sp. P94(2023)]